MLCHINNFIFQSTLSTCFRIVTRSSGFGFPEISEPLINLRIYWLGLICFKFFLRLRQKLVFLRQPGDVFLVPLFSNRNFCLAAFMEGN